MLYGFEFAFSLFLVVNGCIAVTLSDNLYNTCLRTGNLIYAKVGLIIYPMLFLFRATLYLDVF